MGSLQCTTVQYPRKFKAKLQSVSSTNVHSSQTVRKESQYLRKGYLFPIRTVFLFFFKYDYRKVTFYYSDASCEAFPATSRCRRGTCSSRCTTPAATKKRYLRGVLCCCGEEKTWGLKADGSKWQLVAVLCSDGCFLFLHGLRDLPLLTDGLQHVLQDRGLTRSLGDSRSRSSRKRKRGMKIEGVV